MIKFNLFLIALAMAVTLQAKPIKVLQITGHTVNKFHNWQVSSDYCKTILDCQGIFEIDVVLMKDENILDESFSPDFSKYQVVLLNIDDVQWSDKTKLAFENYVKAGGGVVVIHEADNAFPEWKEFNRMIGLGGWGNRDQTSGPYYYFKNDAFVKDTTAGKGGSHGQRVPYVINVRNTKHPITKGLPTKWLHENDELYGNLRGPAENLTVLTTAFSDSKTGGTGKEEPVMMVVSYGKGRIFHSVLGHNDKKNMESMKNVGFQVTLSRGAEWAATGKVKQKVPTDFPSETKALHVDLEKLKSMKK